MVVDWGAQREKAPPSLQAGVEQHRHVGVASQERRQSANVMQKILKLCLALALLVAYNQLLVYQLDAVSF